MGVLVLKHDKDQTLIWSVAFHPKYQRRGLGLCLLGHAEQEAHIRGHNIIQLYTNALFHENIAFYKGF